MLNILRSPSTTENPSMTESLREGGETNVHWIGRHSVADGKAEIVLIGGVDATAFRLRLAQAHVRDTFDPSHWSHIFLLKDDVGVSGDETEIVEIAMEADTAFGYPAASNGVQISQLRGYDDPARYPNIALLRLPVLRKDVVGRLDPFRYQRAVLDAVELLVRWLAFVWGAGKAPNPLHDGDGIPSAAMIEVLCGSAGFDLTPNVPSRMSTPEAIWQAAKWWYGQHEAGGQQPITGAWSTTHRFGPELPREADPQNKNRRPSSRRKLVKLGRP